MIRALGACTVPNEATVHCTKPARENTGGGTTDESSIVQKRTGIFHKAKSPPAFMVANANAKTSFQSTAQYHT